MTIKQTRATKQAELTEVVSAMIGIPVEKLNEMIFAIGVEYIEVLGENDIIKCFIEEPVYWAWWRQQWALIDEIFTSKAIGFEDPDAKEIYLNMHKSVDTFPDATIYKKVHQSYEVMFERLIKNLKTKTNAIQ